MNDGNKYLNAETFMAGEVLEAIKNFSKDNGFYDIAKKAEGLLKSYSYECNTTGYMFFSKEELEEYFPKYLWKYFYSEPFSENKLFIGLEH